MENMLKDLPASKWSESHHKTFHTLVFKKQKLFSAFSGFKETKGTSRGTLQFLGASGPEHGVKVWW